MVIKDCEHYQAVFILELQFIKYLMEQASHMTRRIAECTAPQGSKYQRIMAMHQPHTEDCAYLILDRANMMFCYHTVCCQIWPVHPCYCDKGKADRLIQQSIAFLFTLTEVYCIGSIDSSKVPIERILDYNMSIHICQDNFAITF